MNRYTVRQILLLALCAVTYLILIYVMVEAAGCTRANPC